MNTSTRVSCSSVIWKSHSIQSVVKKSSSPRKMNTRINPCIESEKRKRWEEKRSRKINRRVVNPILLLWKIMLKFITVWKQIFYHIRFFIFFCSDSHPLLRKRIMIRIMTSTRLGVPIYPLQFSCVSMKFQNFDRRSFHIDTANFMTYDLTSLDLDGRLLKKYNVQFFSKHRLRSHEIHDTAVLHNTTYVGKKRM